MGLRLVVRLSLEIDLEPERATFFERAFNADSAALQFDELLGNGKTKARASKPVDDSLIGLGKAIEDAALGIGTDADAGIRDLETQPHAVGTPCDGVDRDVHITV